MSQTNAAPAPAQTPHEPAEVSSSAAIDDPPPFLRTWRNVFALVIGELVVTAILFYALTRWAS